MDSVNKYIEMNHSINVEPCEEGGFFVTIPDLPGCMSQGDTIEEAIEMIMDAKVAWIEVALKRGMDIPLPGDHHHRRARHYQIESLEISLERLPGSEEGFAEAA